MEDAEGVEGGMWPMLAYLKTENDDSKVEFFAVRFCIFSLRNRLRRSQVRDRFDGLAIPPPTYSVDAIGGCEHDDSNVELCAARF